MSKIHGISIQDLSINYGELKVLKHVNLTIPMHKITAIMGPSGCGKTSLIRALTALDTSFDGDIKIDGKSLKQFNQQTLKQYRLKTGVIFQSNALILNLSLFENIALPLRYHLRLSEEALTTRVDALLNQVNLLKFKHYTPEQLSGGMARRAALARSLALNPETLFCDEPFSGQDPLHAKLLADLIKQVNRSHPVTVVMVTHEVNTTLNIADHIVLFNHGSIIAEGSPQQLLESSDAFVQYFFQQPPKTN